MAFSFKLLRGKPHAKRGYLNKINSFNSLLKFMKLFEHWTTVQVMIIFDGLEKL